jgi:hypothetical protein
VKAVGISMVISDPDNVKFDEVVLASYKSPEDLVDGDSKDH